MNAPLSSTRVHHQSSRYLQVNPLRMRSLVAVVSGRGSISLFGFITISPITLTGFPYVRIRPAPTNPTPGPQPAPLFTAPFFHGHRYAQDDDGSVRYRIMKTGGNGKRLWMSISTATTMEELRRHDRVSSLQYRDETLLTTIYSA